MIAEGLVSGALALLGGAPYRQWFYCEIASRSFCVPKHGPLIAGYITKIEVGTS